MNIRTYFCLRRWSLQTATSNTVFTNTVTKATTLIVYILILIDFNCLSYAGDDFRSAVATVSVR